MLESELKESSTDFQRTDMLLIQPMKVGSKGGDIFGKLARMMLVMQK